MISVVSTIYREADSFEVFVRSMLGNASHPEDIELVIINDEMNPEVTERIELLMWEFPQLKVMDKPKDKRIMFLNSVIDFYEGNHIFTKPFIEDMRIQLQKYSTNVITSLWYPACVNYNLGLKRCKGDVIYIGPSDYLVTFDICDIAEKVKSLEKFVSRLDWVDFTSLDPYPEMIEQLKHSKSIYGLTGTWLEQAQKQNLLNIVNQHGVRIINRQTLNRVGYFDERWFIRALHEDLFNIACSVYDEGYYRLMDHPLLTHSRAYVGPVRRNKPETYNYLLSIYDGTPELHNKLKEDIMFFIKEGRGKYED